MRQDRSSFTENQTWTRTEKLVSEAFTFVSEELQTLLQKYSSSFTLAFYPLDYIQYSHRWKWGWSCCSLLRGEDMHAVHFFPLVKAFSEPAGSCGWELLARIVGLWSWNMIAFLYCKLTAFSRSCSGLSVRATSSTRSMKCLVYLTASPGPHFSPSQSSFLSDLIHFHGFRYHPQANDSHRYNSALTSFPDSFCKHTQGFSFPWLFCRHLKCTMSKTESLIPSCPQIATPPLFTI